MRITFDLPDDEAERLEAWRARGRVWSRGEAVRQLLRKALLEDMAAELGDEFAEGEG